jgi:TatD DNase family protein
MNFINIHTHHFKPDTSFQIINQTLKDFNGAPGAIKAVSLGLHPWHVDENYPTYVEMLKAAMLLTKIVAVGEVGLDKIKGPEFWLQKEAFEAQIKLAERANKPLIIHAVKAYQEVLELHKKHTPTVSWIVHGFTGNIQTAEQLCRRGIYLSFGESLLKGHQKTLQAFKETPVNLVFLETDDNPVIEISKVYEKAAKIKNITVDQLQVIIHNNFSKCFNSTLSDF